ncbi:hypothetical protein AVEN_192350-1 [Araneus ventricosus]|uniref:Uncharacterized protein n=1 Tax=Araneus ventricosus TaxID=182803 RepID=A0A4Y2R3P7_ARAVE|nr:hypothetical protein AVEN_192350-1 [Araneus ventricosus]
MEGGRGQATVEYVSRGQKLPYEMKTIDIGPVFRDWGLVLFPQLRGKDQKSCLQWDMVNSRLTLRDLASERPIAVVVSNWEALCTSQPAAALQAHFISPSPQTI